MMQAEKKNFDSTFGKDNIKNGFSESRSSLSASSSGSSSVEESSIDAINFDRKIETHHKNVLESEQSSYQANAILS